MLLDLRGHHLYPKYGPVTRPQYAKLKVESRKKKRFIECCQVGKRQKSSELTGVHLWDPEVRSKFR